MQFYEILAVGDHELVDKGHMANFAKYDPNFNKKNLVNPVSGVRKAHVRISNGKASQVKQSIVNAGKAVGGAAKSAGSATWNATKAASGATWGASKKAASATMNATKVAGGAAWGATKTAGGAVGAGIAKAGGVIEKNPKAAGVAALASGVGAGSVYVSTRKKRDRR